MCLEDVEVTKNIKKEVTKNITNVLQLLIAQDLFKLIIKSCQ